MKRMVKFLMVVLIIGCLIAAGIWIAPDLVLRSLEFTPKGNVNDFWSQLETPASTPVVIPKQPSSMPPRTSAVPSATATVRNSVSSTRQPDLTSTHTVPQASPTSKPELDLSSPTPLATVTPAPDFSNWFEDAITPATLRVKAEGYIDRTMDGKDIFADRFEVGTSLDGLPLGVMGFRESALRALCELWLKGCATDRYRITSVDFRPGGVIVYGSVNVSDLWWQDVGIALALNPSQIAFTPLGLVWNDTVYSLPEEGEIAEVTAALLKQGNTALERLQLQTGEYLLRLGKIEIGDDSITLVWQ